MKTCYIESPLAYTGAELRSLFAYNTVSVQGNSIVAFRGPCDVREHMVDQEDIRLQAFIHSDDMLHFIVELFDLNLDRMIALQHVFVACLKELLEGTVHDLHLSRSGNDLYDGEHKLSVSVATLSPVSCLMHIGINVSSQHTPVPTRGLADYGLDPALFAQKCLQKFQNEFSIMEGARTKVRGVK